MLPRWVPLLGVSVALIGCGSLASSERESGLEQAPIAGGELDRVHTEVFQAFVRWGDGHVSACTATLIAPNLLLTARHCISSGENGNVICGRAGLGSPVNGASAVFTNDPIPDHHSSMYRGAEVRVPAEGSDTCGYDIALVILQSNVSSTVATPAVPRIDRVAESGESYTAIGYGVNAEGESNEGRMSRTDLEVRCTAGACGRQYQVVPNEFLGETGVCSGDSGGPALDADGKVMGVVSRGTDPCETPIYGSVASFRDFIVDTAFDAAATGGYPVPFWAWSGASDPDETRAVAGEACAAGDACRPGHVCYFDADPADAACRAICENDGQCPADHACQPGFDVRGGGLCLPLPEPVAPDRSDDAPTAGGADAGCSMSQARSNSGAGLLVAAAFGLALLGQARRRARG
jgi:V8-like Glu-specific endopeptidase